MSVREIPNNTEVGEHQGPSPSNAALAACFAAAFTAACVVFLLIGHYSVKAPQSLWPFEPLPTNRNAPNQAPFSETFSVASAGDYKKVLGGEKLNPVSGKDYAVFVWFKLRRVPKPGETFALLGKFDGKGANKPGYALSLEGALDGVRPRVYLSTASGGGRWYTFSEYPLSRKHWYLVAVSLSEDTFVSSYITRHGASEPPTFLGGHRIALPTLPSSSADLVVGAFGSSRFRGVVGPFGVLAGKKLREDLVSYIEAMQSQAEGIPDRIDTEDVQMWSTPNRDSGPRGFEVITGTKSDDSESIPESKRVKKLTKKSAGKNATSARTAVKKGAQKEPQGKKKTKGT